MSAHAAGLPLEEVLSLVLTVGGMASAGVRIAWLARLDRRRRRRVLRGRRPGA